MRISSRQVIWLLLLGGCTSQPFFSLGDDASVVVMPLPDSYADGRGYGSVLAPISIEDIDGSRIGGVAVTGGPGVQTDVYHVAEDGEVGEVVRSPKLASICDQDARGDSDSDCFGRGVGTALAYRSTWLDPHEQRQQCLVVGMQGGEDRSPGVGYWCASEGSAHPGDESPTRSMVELDDEVLSLETVFVGAERLFIGTGSSLLVLEGSVLEEADRAHREVSWDGSDLPPPGSAIAAIDSAEAEVPSGYVLALGVPARRQVLIAELQPDPESPTLLPRACIGVDEEGFGSVLRLARLEPSGPLTLLAGASDAYASRVAAVHLFELTLADDPAAVTCEEPSPALSLRCADAVDDQGDAVDRNADCDVPDSDFGVAFDVGNIDDTEELEVVVGSPGATADGFLEAGAAYVFRPAGNGATPLSVLTDGRPTEGLFTVERDDHRLGGGVLVTAVGDRDEVFLGATGDARVTMVLCTGVGLDVPSWDRPVNQTGSLADPQCRSNER